MVYDNDRLYIFLVHYVRWTFRLMFRSLQVCGKENIPEGAAVIYAPNHVNTLLDALAVLSMEERPVVFAARADIFRKKGPAKVLDFLKIIPISRIRDGVEALAENDRTFQVASDTLNAGLPFCIFPEGRHSQELGILPLRKGIARIALKAAGDMGKPVYIVPVGLVYEDLRIFRTSLKINIGKAMQVHAVSEEDSAHESRRILLDLQDSLAALTAEKLPHRKAQVLFLRIVRVPLTFAAAIVMLPAFAIISLILRHIKDRAFDNSIRYVACYLINPLIILILSLILMAAGILPWWGAAGLVMLSLIAPSLYYTGK